MNACQPHLLGRAGPGQPTTVSENQSGKSMSKIKISAGVPKADSPNYGSNFPRTV